MLNRRRHQSVDVLTRLIQITLPQPVLSQRRFEPDVIPPTKPRIALKNISCFMKRHRSLLVLAIVRMINTAIDQRIRFGFHHVMTPRHFDSLFVVLACGLEVVKLAIDPANAVRKARMPKQIAIALRLLQGLVQRGE